MAEPNIASNNKAINVSLIAACRGRYDLLRKFIESAFETASDPNAIEMKLMIDDDDIDSRNIILSYQSKYKTLDKGSQTRNKFLNKNYINVASLFARGRLQWALGNDVELLTQNWDKLLIEQFDDFLATKPDRVAYGYISDDIHKEMSEGGCCFPVITKETVDTLGFLMPPELATWSADHFLWVIFKGLIEDRIIDCRNVRLMHHCFHNGRTNRDDISQEVERNAQCDMTSLQMCNYTNLLNRRIVEHGIT